MVNASGATISPLFGCRPSAAREAAISLSLCTNDVIGSTANYIATGLKWRRGEPWLQEVRAPQNLAAGFSWDQADSTVKHPRSKWIAYGVTYPDGKPLPNDDMPASLVLPMGRTGPAFLAYANFAAYTEWNNSLIYSITAGYLATRIAGAPPMRQPFGPGLASVPRSLPAISLTALALLRP